MTTQAATTFMSDRVRWSLSAAILVNGHNRTSKLSITHRRKKNEQLYSKNPVSYPNSIAKLIPDSSLFLKDRYKNLHELIT